MSQIVTCRNCGSRWSLPPQTTGNVPCPNCQQPLLPVGATAVVTPPVTPPPPPPPPQQPPTPPVSQQPAVSPLATLNLRGRYRSAALRTMSESKSPLDLFDWKFEKYLTPWIVRFTWLAVLIVTGLWLTFVGLSFILSFFPELAFSSSPFSRSPRIGISDDPWLWLLIFRVIGLCTTLIATIVSLLWTRVLLESAIVIFNIAKSLASIDEKTVPPDSA
jgi:hypothetical protein